MKTCARPIAVLDQFGPPASSTRIETHLTTGLPSLLLMADLSDSNSAPKNLIQRRSQQSPMSMNEQQTCGKGLADRSALPAKIGELVAAMVENLEAHQETLEVTDENGKLELHAYVKLAQEFRCTVTQLQAAIAHMAAYRDLPMAKHDPAKMAGPRVVAAFTKFVRLEDDLLALLRPMPPCGARPMKRGTSPRPHRRGFFWLKYSAARGPSG